MSNFDHCMKWFCNDQPEFVMIIIICIKQKPHLTIVLKIADRFYWNMPYSLHFKGLWIDTLPPKKNQNFKIIFKTVNENSAWWNYWLQNWHLISKSKYVLLYYFSNIYLFFKCQKLYFVSSFEPSLNKPSGLSKALIFWKKNI